MEFHISRAIREELGVDGLLFSYSGNVVFANVSASRKLAGRLNELRGAGADPERIVNGGSLFAMGLIDELSHALVERYRKEIDPEVHAEALRWFAGLVGAEELDRLLLTFVEQFPGMKVYRGEMPARQWLAGTTEGFANREAALEEMMLLWLGNMNPATRNFRELFDDAGLKGKTLYSRVTASLPDYLSTRPPVDSEVGSLFEALRAPMLASPDSITGQLEFIRKRWSKYLGEDLARLLLAIDVVREEDVAIWMRFHPAGPDNFRHGQTGWGAAGFVGDEYVGFEEEYVIGPDGRRTRRYASDYQAPLNEYEAFSADQAWMPNVVLLAKSTYVWLEQLSKKYQRHIRFLQDIPDEELRLMADRGITGLWLIGLWERSVASKTVKRLRGHADAVASAYSLKEYNIAEDLGGESGYRHLREQAARYGVRLASDMVPNHMGIDSPWVIEHPDWFLHRYESPFPVYQFKGPDVSSDSRVEIKIEDHYYDQTDAAVAFRVRHYADGATRYIYHGNDGTTFAWNDTAQLDYSKASVREHVIQVILEVARRFPIIRFDAAMVLAKRHVQRLWFPLPGAGGSIPSRAEDAMSQEEFEKLMPHEFWREVVDRVAVEVPGTLLLAEAFWLLESYFVRTLGMHRVYNSAFMNMLRDEENAKYRSYLKKTIEFDPDILKRYVNFMSNPDEKTAIAQFGSGDKFFGTSTLLATLPGLPMFGHGQIEGYGEQYGMEFKTAKMDETPNEDLMARHQRDIAPLLKHRWQFAESTNFAMYDFWNEHGTVDENVFAYSNRMHGQRSIVFYNNRYESTRGSIHHSVHAMDKGSGELRQTSLSHALGLPGDHSLVLGYREVASGLEYLRRASEIYERGMQIELRGYQYVVCWQWRELRSTAEYPWDRLCDALAGAGVPSVDEALKRLRLYPVYESIRHAVNSGSAHTFAKVGQELWAAEVEGKVDAGEGVDGDGDGRKLVLDSRLSWFEENGQKFFEQVRKHAGGEAGPGVDSGEEAGADVGRVSDPAAEFASRFKALALAAERLPVWMGSTGQGWPPSMRAVVPAGAQEAGTDRVWAPVLGWVLLGSVPPHGATTKLFDELNLRTGFAEAFGAMGLEGEGAWRVAALLRVLLLLAEDVSLVFASERFWADADVRWLAGVNDSGEKSYVNKEQLEELVIALQIPALLELSNPLSASKRSIDSIVAKVSRVMGAADKAGYELAGMMANLQTAPDACEAGKAEGKVVAKAGLAEPGLKSAQARGAAKLEPDDLALKAGDIVTPKKDEETAAPVTPGGRK